MSEVILQRIQDCSFKNNVPEKDLECRIQPPIIIGRGPILKCPDKKISRNHATIDWDDDGILITSTHGSPTFLVINGKEKTLSKGNSAVLYDGDKFGLFKETFWYKICLNSSPKPNDKKELSSLENGVLVEEKLNSKQEVKLPIASPENKTKTVHDNSFSELEDKKLDCPSQSNVAQNGTEAKEEIIQFNLAKDETEVEKNSCVNNTPVIEKKQLQQNLNNTPTKETYECVNRDRDLPKWIQNCDGKKRDSKATSDAKAKATPHGKVQQQKPSTSPRKVKPKQNLHHSDEEEKETKEKETKKKEENRKKKSPKKESPPKKANHYHTVSQDFDVSDIEDEPEDKKAKKHHVISDDEEPSPVKEASNARTSNETTFASPQKTPAKNTQPPNKEDLKMKMNKTSAPRQSCEYGAQCYRKNPNHRRTMAHPGDADYASPPASSSDGGSDDDREECEFGLNCYRRNPQHKKTHKHTRKPQPQRQAKRQGKRRRDEADDDSDNEYDFDDPFFNDSSSDDYAPTDSTDSDTDVGGDAGEEDTKRLMKEAKKFVKKKRRK